MTKQLIFLFLFATIQCQCLFAQKHDYNWLYGYVHVTPDTINRNGLLLNFNEDEVQASIFDKQQWLFLTSLSYSDAEGNLQLYSDGCALYDENAVLLENGDDLNDSPFCGIEDRLGYPANQGMIALPTSDQNLVAIFYDEQYIITDSVGSKIVIKLNRALVDIQDNIVLSKKETYLDTLGSNILSATKHSNGQDWWIINQDYYTNEYKCLLISEGEVIDTVSSFIGNPILSSGGPQSNFSPDGKSFARFNPADELQLFDFDRSTGLLSNYRFIDIPSTLEGTIHTGGLAFSGSSRYLYVNEALGIWQLDTQAEDIASSMVQVAERDTFATTNGDYTIPIGTFFYRMALAPDCRIYMSSRSGVDRLYVIMEPDQKGLDCDVVQNIKIPVWNDGTTPHFPNYRLDNEPFCDSSKEFPSNLMTTVSTSSPIADTPIRAHVFPNPADTYCKVYLKNIDATEVYFSLYDLLGRSLLQQQIPINNGEALVQVSLESIPTGLYVYKLHLVGQILASDRIVVE